MSDPRKKNGHRWRQLQARVLREEHLCALCGHPVDKTLHHHDPGAPEVDHKLPVSKGGPPYARWNAQLAHRLCNQRKSNKTEPDSTPRPAPVKPRVSRAW